MLIRLNKYLASIGLASRRQIDHYLTLGQITVNDQPAKLGHKINPTTDQIKFNNQLVSRIQPKLIYLALNKPVGYVSTTKDTHSRPTVLDLVPNQTRLFPVGRLDADSSGLILLTNDGALTLKLTHPRYHLPKTYQVTITSQVSKSALQSLSHGVNLIDGRTAPAKVAIYRQLPKETILTIVLFQGKKRQIRRMCLALKLRLTSLHRIQIGPIKLGDLASGHYRVLSPAEISLLKSV